MLEETLNIDHLRLTDEVQDEIEINRSSDVVGGKVRDLFCPDHHGHVLRIAAALKRESGTESADEGHTADDKSKEASTDADKPQRWLESQKSAGNNSVLQCCEDVNKRLHDITEPLNMISVVGTVRIGKSTLMNLLAGCTTEPLFTTSAGSTSCTKGINIGKKTMTLEEFSTGNDGTKVTPELPKQRIAFVDAEGQGDEDDTSETILFTPPILCSRIVLFMTTSVARNDILQKLDMMKYVADKLDFGSNASGYKFGHLVILINQYTLGNESTLRSKVLDAEPETDESASKTKRDAIKQRNEIRKKLRTDYESVSLHTLPGNALKDGVSDEISKSPGTQKSLTIGDFKDNYVQRFRSFQATLSGMLKHPRVVGGKSLSGTATADFVSNIVNSINKLEKDGKLDIPNSWTAAQNDAINKACIAFRHDFGAVCDELNHSKIIISQKTCNENLDEAIHKYMSVVQDSLSYLPLKDVEATQKALAEEAKDLREAVLRVNLGKVRTFASAELTKLTGSLNKSLLTELGDFKQLNTEIVQARFNKVKEDWLEDYKKRISDYDADGLPDQYADRFKRAFDTASAEVRQAISSQWGNWVSENETSHLATLNSALAELTKSTSVGNLSTWEVGADSAETSSVSDFNHVIDHEYIWQNPDVIKTTYKATAANAKSRAKSAFQKNDTEVKDQIQAELDSQLAKYQRKLNDSLTPNVDPGDYTEITNPKTFRDALQKFIGNENVSATLSSSYMDKFDDSAATGKRDFYDRYVSASTNFPTYLTNELKRIVPDLLLDFKQTIDAISISRNMRRSSLISQVDTAKEQCLGSFENQVSPFKVTSETPKSRVNGFLKDLKRGIADERNTRVDRLGALVANWNRETLNNIVNPIMRQAAEFVIDTSGKLKSAVDTAKIEYFRAACGPKEEQEDTWNSFSKKAVDLYKNIDRMNALSIQDVSTTSSTSSMETSVINGIKSDIAQLANLLGMSWICGSTEFQAEISADGKARTHLLKNKEKINSGYDREHRTNLRFENRKAEFSDFVFDEPIVQELRPFEMETVTVPVQDESVTHTVNINQGKKYIVSNTNSTMVGVENEYKATCGVEGVASGGVSLKFHGSHTWGSTTQNEHEFTVNYSMPVVCPAKRVTTIKVLAFEQLTSVTYSAKMRLIPQVTFTGGFTRWGGENNEYPNYLKGHSRERVYTNIENGYTNEFKTKASGNSNPWEWKDCIDKYHYVQTLVDRISKSGNYEFYVRGRWEGVSGIKIAIETDNKLQS